MLHGAICGAVRGHQLLDSVRGPSFIHPQPGKAPGGWGGTDAPPLPGSVRYHRPVKCWPFMGTGELGRGCGG